MAELGVCKIAGVLSFQLLDGTVINCICIKEPYITMILEAQAEHTSNEIADYCRELEDHEVG